MVESYTMWQKAERNTVIIERESLMARSSTKSSVINHLFFAAIIIIAEKTFLYMLEYYS